MSCPKRYASPTVLYGVMELVSLDSAVITDPRDRLDAMQDIYAILCEMAEDNECPGYYLGWAEQLIDREKRLWEEEIRELDDKDALLYWEDLRSRFN